MLYNFKFIMFKTIIILYARNFWVIEGRPKRGRHSRTGWRPWPQLPEVCRLMTWVRSCQETGNNNPGTSFSAIAKKLKLICGNCRAG